MHSIKEYSYIFFTIFFTVYGQLVIKWQIAKTRGLPDGSFNKMLFLVRLCLNPWISSSLLAAFLAALFWMAAMTRFDLSYAYPFTSLSFVLVLAISFLFLGEPVTLPKLIGMALITGGIVIGAQG